MDKSAIENPIRRNYGIAINVIYLPRGIVLDANIHGSPMDDESIHTEFGVTVGTMDLMHLRNDGFSYNTFRRFRNKLEISLIGVGKLNEKHCPGTGDFINYRNAFHG